MTKVRALVWVLAVLVLMGFAAGCGQVSDQARQEAKKKVENKGQQAQQDAKKKVNAKKQEVKKKVEAGQEDVKKIVNDLQKKVNDLQKEVSELQKKINAQEDRKRAEGEGRSSSAAEPEAEEVDLRLVRECVVSADFNAETEKAKLAEHHLPELRRTPCLRSSQNFSSRHFGE